jgi:hypothetical protein
MNQEQFLFRELGKSIPKLITAIKIQKLRQRALVLLLDASTTLNKFTADLRESSKELPGISPERLQELRGRFNPILKTCISKYRTTKSAMIDWMETARIANRSARRLFTKNREEHQQVVEDAVSLRELAIMTGVIVDFQVKIIESQMNTLVASCKEHQKKMEDKSAQKQIGGSRQQLAEQETIPDMVDLDQAAAMVNREKRTLERYVKNRKLPPPKILGRGGKKSEWLWAEIRPALETHFSRQLPARPPHTAR